MAVENTSCANTGQLPAEQSSRLLQNANAKCTLRSVYGNLQHVESTANATHINDHDTTFDNGIDSVNDTLQDYREGNEFKPIINIYIYYMVR